ncbi:pitrilysin family protein [Chelatococcus sp. SYSU_G07232]|uniref:Pitrilysin family protein n=1 Tax=Chelatococcus albus TaxID=3047466 RepID=A0ABT7AEQ4_9HYPH|nr:pitrilysin family protein [Chelatococcus sp. SYSU_G07232]MDJ1157859.1 pitrilysin family protein [Chelatococcus sp. SYSU_G07232]
MNATMPLPSDARVRVTTLDGGLRVASEAMPHLATAAVGVWIGTGARHERLDEHGLSHLLEHMAFKGTRRRSARAIAEAIEAVGGELNAETSVEYTAYGTRLLGEDVPLALDILADILTESVFDAAELAREKGVILQEIGAVEDAPDDLVTDVFLETAFPDQPIGRRILGTPKTVRGFDREAITAFLAREYRAPQVVVSAVGAVDHERLVADVARLFAALPGGAAPPAAPARFAGGEARLERDLEQAHLVIGFPGCSYHQREQYAVQVFGNLLGGGMSSRLFQEVREERGLAYAVDAFHWPFADTGIFGISAGTDPQDLAALVPVALDCLMEAAAGATDEEVARAKAQMKVSLLTALESPGNRAEQIARQILAFNRVIPREEIVGRIDAITTEEVRRAGGALAASSPVVAAIGPLAGLPSLDAIRRHLGSPR